MMMRCSICDEDLGDGPVAIGHDGEPTCLACSAEARNMADAREYEEDAFLLL